MHRTPVWRAGKCSLAEPPSLASGAQTWPVRTRFWVAAVMAIVLVGGFVRAQPARSAEPRQFVGTDFVGAVTSVVDGDTVHVLSSGGVALTVRLEGIDCPETGEPFSAQARNSTRVMLFSKQVNLKGTDVDRYGRLVARISVDGVDSSVELVRSGLACHFTKYSSDHQLAEAQRSAQKDGRGFWARGAEKPACAVESRRRAAPVSGAGPFHGNTSSHVFHDPSCRNYACKNCTAVFASAEAAVAAGFKPAADCLR